MIIPLSVKNQSIETSGITKDYKEALCEYIWNGLEANATRVDINYSSNAAYGLAELTITDNGEGINYNEISETFGAFLASKKNLLSLKTKSKANKGKGRFSFIAFASGAQWSTVYRENDKFYRYIIALNDGKKQVLDCTQPEEVKEETGTKISFEGITSLNVENMSFEHLEPMILKEFAWFLYLFKDKNIEIYINDNRIDYGRYINEELSEKQLAYIDDYAFEISLVVWQKTIKEKYCCYYFDDENSLIGKETTTFNRNTIGFTHSVFVKSIFFKDENNINIDDDEQINMFRSSDGRKTLKKLHKVISKLIEKKIGIYLSQRAEEAVAEMRDVNKTFPEFSNDIYGQMRKNDFEKVTKEIYKLEPRIFFQLKKIQERSFLGFLNLLLSSEERENVLTIVEQIVELSPEQRGYFSEMLKKTSLENIIDTIKYIEERYKVIELLKTIVYDLSKFANERDHIQKIVEQQFWLFGEQYHLASADQRMQKALEQYRNILYGEDDIEATLLPDAAEQRRMDIFMCNARTVETAFQTSIEENIVLELKAPKVKLSKKVLRQIEDYMDYVRKQPQFNSELRRWKFISVCKEVDEDVKAQYKAFADKGKVGLVFQVENYEVYALTWDDIFKSFELKHKPQLERLKYDREKIAEELLQEIKREEGRNKVDVLTEIAVSAIDA